MASKQDQYQDQLSEGDNDDNPVDTKDPQLRKLQDFMDNRFLLVCTAVFTFFCLFGEDVRICFFGKAADNFFYFLFIICLLYFIFEFVLFSIIQDGYRWGFFFWLDLAATVSLLLDIDWISDALVSWRLDWLDNYENTTSFLDSDTTGVIGMVRLIRLIRLMKLYKMTTARSETDQQDRLREEARTALNAKQAALKRVEASRLGKQLSDMITRIVILGILLVLICLPLIKTSVVVDNSRWLGLRNLYWVGENVCGRGPDGSRSPCLVAENGEIAWKWQILQYAGVTRENSDSKLLWLYVTSYPEKGKLRDIERISLEVNGKMLTWKQTIECAGIRNPNCPWRDDEQDLIVYEERGIRTYAKFLKREERQQEAILNMLLTLFVIVVLCVLIFVFARDTQILVVAPIEKMVNIVKQLADDPLRQPTMEPQTEESSEKQKSANQLETSMLETTILKIGGLLQVGFGEAGASIIGRNMRSGDGDLNIMIPGEKVQAIFGFCDIRSFTEITECLQEDVMVFINTVGNIVHNCCHLWNGAANQNVGDAFLFTWKLGHAFEADRIKDNHEAVESGEMANKALVAFVKTIVEIRRNSDLIAFERDPRMTSRFGVGYRLKIGYGLHVGWAIEGAIGSDFKIDASYLSPHVTLTQRIQEATKIYHTPLLLSESVYFMLSVKSKGRIRKVDVVKADENQAQHLGLYCFDINDQIPRGPADPQRVLGDVVKPDDVLEIPTEHLRGPGVEYMFVVDADISTLQEGFSDQLYTEYRAAFCKYIEGEWGEASEGFKRCLEILPGDGPSTALLDFMKRTDFKAPENWRGYRILPILKKY
ncbi:adenylate and guanylate cyclase catalytic domain-containing protein [Toxoplasma gondii RUB]|uniref:Adenylate and guanylate cyclase catalytic domain-containing protein n=3 Tax=Toxoplasma gondii TaxID=5811 RepID=A0A086LP24_TOXGO|nr:adenylate and guanylate cyclase catalytic domain-containing protein [Toxoplasma gondii p89]KFG58392.1 adenylate and guanylate cyclase catalytic domain-containing protein [Toxoplasma gondii RUB]RQX67300.1 adenylate and guanylate cyclase catalytic domain-containing protein [Toxoplasma gondii CAST]